jgi:hypothetical protein
VVEEFEYRHGAGEGANEALTVEASHAYGPSAVIKIVIALRVLLYKCMIHIQLTASIDGL